MNNNEIDMIQDEVETKRGRDGTVIRRKKQRGEDNDPLALGKSRIAYRKWQRSVVKPQFSLNKEQALDLIFKHLRGRRGRGALKTIVMKGFAGVGKLSNTELADYLKETALLSRYPHEVLITR